MEPAFVRRNPFPRSLEATATNGAAQQRGDLLFLWNRNLLRETEVGEIVVYNVQGKDIPIVHRVVRKFGTGYVCAGSPPLCNALADEMLRQTRGQASDEGRQQCWR
jgi:signal peptidase